MEGFLNTETDNPARTMVVAALDQGTSSTRVILFNKAGNSLFTHQVELAQVLPQPGWVEEKPEDISETSKKCLDVAAAWAEEHDVDIVCLGVTNQRETTMVWDRETGQPFYNAIVWLDTRTKDVVEAYKQQQQQQRTAKGKKEDCSGTPSDDNSSDNNNNNNSDNLSEEELQRLCGLPLATYFSALKLRWLIDNVPEVAAACAEGRCAFGTVDTWLIWCLSGGRAHVTDVSNASRTMLMNIETLEWDARLCRHFGIPMSVLPRICSSSEVYARVSCGSALDGLPIAGCLGDQQGALVGQLCLAPGLAKSTYGTGCFMLRNIGTKPLFSQHGLITTVAYKLGPAAPAHYALEGSVAIAGAAVTWLRDNLCVITKPSDIQDHARTVEDTGGVYFVPAFSGLFAPRWRPDARGVVVGLTQFTTRAHLCRAVLEATCFQTLEVLQAMESDAADEHAKPLLELRVDGGMTKSDLIVQLQADLLGIPAVRPEMRETTALGAAIAAGLAVGVWSLSEDGTTVEGIQRSCTTFNPTTQPEEREARLQRWKMAVERSLNWV